MTNLLDKARAGRTEALRQQAERRAIRTSLMGEHARAASERRNEIPFFMSSRIQPAMQNFLH